MKAKLQKQTTLVTPNQGSPGLKHDFDTTPVHSLVEAERVVDKICGGAAQTLWRKNVVNTLQRPYVIRQAFRDVVAVKQMK